MQAALVGPPALPLQDADAVSYQDVVALAGDRKPQNPIQDNMENYRKLLSLGELRLGWAVFTSRRLLRVLGPVYGWTGGLGSVGRAQRPCLGAAHVAFCGAAAGPLVGAQVGAGGPDSSPAWWMWPCLVWGAGPGPGRSGVGSSGAGRSGPGSQWGLGEESPESGAQEGSERRAGVGSSLGAREATEAPMGCGLAPHGVGTQLGRQRPGGQACGGSGARPASTMSCCLCTQGSSWRRTMASHT
ncbi:Paternally-expressed gene 3 protein [Galemys pyrenaicus]|uniref:Paternally-expressed gene 3 protein n=1 Tax=Galemys pyrenaicus TaxID=202257 RepID=A0A8J6DHX8_GALPY|nr:Paternally-expressed gene 3 protein [Galemys pyrenaicus]